LTNDPDAEEHKSYSHKSLHFPRSLLGCLCRLARALFSSVLVHGVLQREAQLREAGRHVVGIEHDVLAIAKEAKTPTANVTVHHEHDSPSERVRACDLVLDVDALVRVLCKERKQNVTVRDLGLELIAESNAGLRIMRGEVEVNRWLTHGAYGWLDERQVIMAEAHKYSNHPAPFWRPLDPTSVLMRDRLLV